MVASTVPICLAYEVSVSRPEAKDVVDTAIEAGSFTTLVAAVKAADLVKTLRGKGPFTVLAPTDEAFKKLPAGTIDMLLKPENKAKLQAILTYHVIPKEVMAKDIGKAKFAPTVNGQMVTVSTKDEKYRVVMIDNAKVVKTDIVCSNGVIHVLDAVMLPSEKDIVDTAAAAGSFGTLVKAVAAADLADALKGKGPFTVFAPTDQAFANLPEGALADLLKPENKATLQSILKYHVATGRIMSTDVVKQGIVKTLNGQMLTIHAEEEAVTINGAKIVRTDIQCTNGVIHVIDAVVMPK